MNTAGGSLFLSGNNGTPGVTYSVLASSNLLAPLMNWNLAGGGVFDSSGAFDYTNIINPAAVPGQYYLIRIP
jgi:hypothetical protein